MQHEQILRKEDDLYFEEGGFFKSKIKGSLVLTTTELYFTSRNTDTKVFSIVPANILNVRAEAFLSGYDPMLILYTEDGEENTIRIKHRVSMVLRSLRERVREPYFKSWEALLNESRLGQTNTLGSVNDLEKLAELHEKGILTAEEFTAKKKQLLGI